MMNILKEFEEMVQGVQQHPDNISKLRFKAKLKNGTDLEFHFDRRRWEKEQQVNGKEKGKNEIFNAVFDILGASTSIVLLVILVMYARLSASAVTITTLSLFGIILILYFLFSTIYHFFPRHYTSKDIFDKLREIIRFFVIAISCSVVFLDFMGGDRGLMLFGGQLILAVTGIYLLNLGTKLAKTFSRIIALAMPWLIVFGFPRLFDVLGGFNLILLFFSASFYTLWGLSPFFNKRNTGTGFNASNMFLLFGALGFFWIMINRLSTIILLS